MGNAKNRKSSSSREPPASPGDAPQRPTPAAQRLAAAEAVFESMGINFGSIVAESMLDRLMKEGKVTSALDPKEYERKKAYSSLKPTDIIFGRGVKAAAHSGNVLFRHIIAASQEAYLKLPDREQQKQAIDLMINYFDQVLGTRFVEEASGGRYQSVAYDRIYEKFINLFRETREKWCSAIKTHEQVIKSDTPISKSSIDALSKSLKNSSSSQSCSSVEAEKLTPRASKVQARKRMSKDESDIEDDQETSVDKSARKKSPRRSTSIKSYADSEGEMEEGEGEDGFGAHFSKSSRRARARMDRSRDLDAQPIVTQELESVRKSLENDGISVERFLFEARIEKLRKKYRPSRLSTMTWDEKNPPTYSQIAPCDVLLGRGHTVQKHSGNVLMRHVMALNHDYYQSLKRTEKDPAADALVSYFELKGIRFLEENNGVYEAVNYARVVEKFKSCIRTGIAAYQGPGGSNNDAGSEEPDTVPSISPSSEVKPKKRQSEPKKPPVENRITREPLNLKERILNEMYEAENELKKHGMSVTEFIAGSKLEDLTNPKNFKYSQLSQTEQSTNHKLAEYSDVQPLDIIFGRGNVWNRHPGNWLFRQVVAKNQAYYRNGISRAEKPVAADALVGRFELLGTRFLEATYDNDSFVEVEYRRVVEKFKQGLREKILAKSLLSETAAKSLSSTPKVAAASRNSKRRLPDSFEENESDVQSEEGSYRPKPEKKAAPKITPDKSKASLSQESSAPKPARKKAKTSDYVKKNPEDYLRGINHFVMRVQCDDDGDDEEEELDEEELACRLRRLRFAFRRKTSQAGSSKPQGNRRHEARAYPDKEMEKLMELYRPSRFSRLGNGTFSPRPVFFQDG